MSIVKYTQQSSDCQGRLPYGACLVRMVALPTFFRYAVALQPMLSLSPQLKQASDHSLLVSFGDDISPEHHRRIFLLTHQLLFENNAFIRNVHPAYTTVLVSFNPLLASYTTVRGLVESLLQKLDTFQPLSPRTIEIPVCYGGSFGPDLTDVASHNHLTPDDVVRIHSSGEYLVYFLGFSPGFPYLGGLSEAIATPRLDTPRTKTPAGSVAIGGRQTGIYPISSPGGWRIIGRTPLRLFRPGGETPTLLQMGDVVRFLPISKEAFEKLRQPLL